MGKRVFRFLFVVLFLLLLVFVILVSYQRGGVVVEEEKVVLVEPPNRYYCDVPSDCVKDRCCHSARLVNKYYAPNCSDPRGICTHQCMPDTLDCRGWEATCINNTCGVR